MTVRTAEEAKPRLPLRYGDQHRRLAGDDCKQVSASPVSKTVIGRCARLTGFLTPIPEAQGHAQLSQEVMQRVR